MTAPHSNRCGSNWRCALRRIYVVATAIAVGVLIYQAYDTADSLNDRELSLRAADLAGNVTVDPGRSCPARTASGPRGGYQASGNADIFAIRRGIDAIVAASPPSFGDVTAKWPLGTDDPSYFRLKDFGRRAAAITTA